MTDEQDAGAAMDLDGSHGDDHDHDPDGTVVARSDDAGADGDGARSRAGAGGPADAAGAGAEGPPGDGSAIEAAPADLDPGDASLLALVDRLGSLLDRSELSELAVEAGRTRLVLRKPVAAAPILAVAPTGSMTSEDGTGGAATAGAPGAGAPTSSAGSPGPTEAPARPSVKAPLTGVWYSSPAPGSAPFVAAGREVAVGQVIGLIEAMKLFNEIKSDLAGRVVRVIPDSGALVKAKQPLIEVEPL